VNLIVGGRAEDYTGKTDTAELTAFKQFLFQMQARSIILLIQSILMSIIIKDNAAKYISIEPNNTIIKIQTLITLVIQTYNLLFL
jgi:hypothetical protein